MKKQYLISLLGLAAIFVPVGNTFIEANSSNSTINTDKLQKTYKDEYFNYSIEQISMGDFHSAAVVNDGTEDGDSLYTWGYNASGQLGLGDDADKKYYAPQEVVTLSGKDIEQIEMGSSTSFAVVNDETGTNDTLYAWGENKKGELGVGENYGSSVNTPIKVTGLPEGDIEDISTSSSKTAVVVNNVYYTWGYNNRGWELGLGDGFTDNEYYVPQKLTTLPEGEIEQIEMTNYSSAAVVNDGTGADGDLLYTWGNDQEETLGNGPGNTSQETPTSIILPKGDIEDLEMGAENGGVIIDNVLYTWGVNYYGQLGLGDEFDNVKKNGTPEAVTIPIKNAEIQQFEFGKNYASAIINNTLYTWGSNEFGQLGLGNKTDYNTPQEVSTLPEGTIKQISAGDEFVGALVEDENDVSLYAWGYNYYGQLGLGNDEDYDTPQKVEIGFPYFTNVLDSSVNAADPKNIIISYEFETNLDVVSVATNLDPNEGETPYISYPEETSEGSEIYKGTQTISSTEIVDGGEYSYSLDLNYEDAMGTIQILEDFSSGTFTLAALVQEPEIIAEDVIIDNENPQHKASVDYTVTEGGTDPDGNVLTLDEVVWMELDADGEGNDKQLASSKDDDNSNPGALKGTLTCDELEANKNYENTVLIAKYNEGDGEWDTQDEVKPFQMDSAASPTTITLAEIDTKKTTKRKARINYEIDLGKNANDDDTKIKSIKWMYGEQTLATSKTNNASGYLTAKGLTPGTSYDNTTLVVELDEGEVDPKPVQGEFVTISTAKDTTAEITKQPEEGEITENSASVSYAIDRGRGPHGGFKYTVSEVEWIDLSDDSVLASSSDSSGTLTAEGLAEGTPYNTELKITMNEGNDVDNLSIDPFTTSVTMTDVNDIPTITNEEVILLSATSASIHYTVEKGNSPYKVTNVEWINNGQVLASSTKDSGTLTAEGLAEGTTYDSTQIVVTYEETGTVTSSVNSFTTGISMIDIEPIVPDTNNGMGWKMITLIIIGAIALIALFSGILTWLSKRNKKNN